MSAIIKSTPLQFIPLNSVEEFKELFKQVKDSTPVGNNELHVRILIPRGCKDECFILNFFCSDDGNHKVQGSYLFQESCKSGIISYLQDMNWSISPLSNTLSANEVPAGYVSGVTLYRNLFGNHDKFAGSKAQPESVKHANKNPRPVYQLADMIISNAKRKGRTGSSRGGRKKKAS